MLCGLILYYLRLCDFMLYYLMMYYLMMYNVMPCGLMLCGLMLCGLMLCGLMLCGLMLCDLMPCDLMPCLQVVAFVKTISAMVYPELTSHFPTVLDISTTYRSPEPGDNLSR